MAGIVASTVAAGIGAVGSFLGARSQSDAANRASEAQVASSQAAIAEQRRQFDVFRQLLQPYVDSGVMSLRHQEDMLGLSGPDSQAKAIQNIIDGPLYSGLLQQGEDAILQNASATGGLRGGNTQAALSQYRPQLLNNLLNQRFGQLGQITGMGQSSAAGVGQGAMQMGTNVGNLLNEQGSYIAGNAMAQNQATQGMYSGLSGSIGQALSALGRGGYFGNQSPTQTLGSMLF